MKSHSNLQKNKRCTGIESYTKPQNEISPPLGGLRFSFALWQVSFASGKPSNAKETCSRQLPAGKLTFPEAICVQAISGRDSIRKSPEYGGSDYQVQGLWDYSWHIHTGPRVKNAIWHTADHKEVPSVSRQWICPRILRWAILYEKTFNVKLSEWSLQHIVLYTTSKVDAV